MKTTLLLVSTILNTTFAASLPILSMVASASSTASSGASATAISAPLAFEAAQGQVPPGVRYLARGEGYRLYLGQNDFEVALIAPDARDPHPRSPSAFRVARLQASIVGAAPDTRPEPIQASSASVNYFLGNDPAAWLRNVPTFKKIQYAGVYPGVDLVFYGNQQSLEYDFIVRPGADPAQIRLAFRGAEDAELDHGDLVLHCATGEFRHRRPVLYQLKNGTRVPVSGEYVLQRRCESLPTQPGVLGSDSNEGGSEGQLYFLSPDHSQTLVQISFKVGEYDHSAPLWIDPVLDYGTFLGGTGTDSGQGVAVDANGNMYITGQTLSTDFPTTLGAYDSSCGTDGLCNGGHSDVFVTKLDAAGTTRLYSTYLGGSGDEQSWGVAVDTAGRAHVMGWTTSVDFPTRNAFQTAIGGSRDAFVTSFDSNGALLYSTYLGGNSDMDADIDGGIAVDPQGKVYVTGRTDSTDFPVRNAFQAPGAGLRAFFAKLDPLGSGNASLLYSTCLGGTNGDNGATGIAVDSTGNAYITGYTTANDFPVKGAAQPLFGGIRDSFVAKFDPTKTGAASLLYATYLGGSGEEAETSGDIAVDSLGQAWVTGATRSGADFPLRNPLQSYGGDWDAYVTKLSASGDSFLFSTFLGGSGADAQLEAHIATDPNGNAYVTGHTLSSDFPVTQGTALAVDSVYVAKYDAAGTSVRYSLVLGAGEGRGIAVDSSRNVYVTGQTSASSFPTRNALQSSLSGPSDAFLVRLRPSVTDVAVQVAPSLSTIDAGKALVFLVTATNQGPDSAVVIVTNLLPAGFSFSAFPADCFYHGNEVDSPLLQLAAHAARTFLLEVRPATVGPLTFSAFLQPDDGDTNATNDSATSTVSVVTAGTAPTPAALRLRDWDYVALKWNTGELVADSQLGVLGSPMGTLDGAVNLMLTNRARALFLAQGPSGDGVVAFGFLNKTNWIPVTRDGNDLPTVVGDRVFATVDGMGNVQLISAAPFSAGIVLATNHVTLSPNQPFRLAIDPVQDLVRLYYGGQVVAQGNPFTGADEATRAAVGNDFAVSILGGTADLAYAILNDRPLKSLVVITALQPLGANQLRITFQDAGSGATNYSLLSAPTPTGPWTPVAGVNITSSGGGVYQATLPRPASSSAFYRLQLSF
jgi:uncharacterized repeat protein (TIGR01451 family)